MAVAVASLVTGIDVDAVVVVVEHVDSMVRVIDVIVVAV